MLAQGGAQRNPGLDTPPEFQSRRDVRTKRIFIFSCGTPFHARLWLLRLMRRVPQILP